MKKLLTLFTLLLTVCSGAWGAVNNTTVTKAGGTQKFIDVAATAASNGDEVTVSEQYIAYTCNELTGNTIKGVWYTQQSSGSGSSNSDEVNITGYRTACNKYLPVKKGNTQTFYVTKCISFSVLYDPRANDRYLTITATNVDDDKDTKEITYSGTISSGKKYSVELNNLEESKFYRIEVATTQTSDSRFFQVRLEAQTDSRTPVTLSFPNDTEDATLGESFSAPTLTVSPAAASTAVAYSSSDLSIAEVNSSTGEITLKKGGSTVITAAISGNATYKDASASYTLNVTDPNAPSLIVSPASLTLTANANNPSPSAVFNVAGANLTDGNYNITVPSIAGLSVSPTSVTVADGSVNQEVTVTYAPSVDAASSSDDIILTIDEIDATITINYTATLSVYSQETISETTIWDFVNGIAHDAEGNDDVKPGSATAATLYANTSGIVFESSFPKTSLTWSTSAKNLFAYRKANKCSQGAVLSFKTSVPGKVTVLFAHNGSGSQYVKVNNVLGVIESTDGGGSGTTAKEESFQVEAGTVTITGSDPTKIRIFRIKFQPTTSVTITDAKYATFASDSKLDFSNMDDEGLYAYTAEVSGDELTFTKVTGSTAAGEGLLLYSETAKTYNVPVATNSPAKVNENKLVRGTGAAVASTDDEGATYNYVLSSKGEGDVNFYRANGNTVPTNKAYLKDISASAPSKFFLPTGDKEGEETDGIKSVQGSRFTVNGEAYNLAGQKVGADYKGIVIVNGKKVIRK